MVASILLAFSLATLWPTTYADTVLGAYIFQRHGDRTPKLFAPTNLTDLGYRQVFNAGKFYRKRYLQPSSAHYISEISTNVYNQEQFFASAPLDTVLQNSATGFLQGLYPPNPATAVDVLRSGQKVKAPMNGYQLIPVSIVESGTASESAGWLQDSTECANAETSSNEYYYSSQYEALYKKTLDFYHSLEPVMHKAVNLSTDNYKNAYYIFDYLNYAEIHNQSIPHDKLLTPAAFFQIRTLADAHEYNLAYNASSKIRAIAGMQLAAEIVDFFESTIESGQSGDLFSNKLSIQFGSYATFQSFFGLADLPAASPNFYGIPGYASSMVFELYTTSDNLNGKFPSMSDLMIRFFFRNGTTSTKTLPLNQFALFGGKSMDISYSDFKSSMGKFSIGTTGEWCRACGNYTGSCLPYASNTASTSSSGSSSSSSSSSSGDGVSLPVAGVIGAVVTLAVILIVEALIYVGFNLTLVKRSKLHVETANGVDGMKEG